MLNAKVNYLSFARGLLVAFVVAVCAAPIASIAAQESHVWVSNTSDKWVWFTAFTRHCDNPNAPTPASAGCTNYHIVHEWCVPPTSDPKAINKTGFHVELSIVHILVTMHPNCGRPIVKEWALPFHVTYGRFSMKHQYNVTTQNVGGVKTYDVEDVP